MTRQSHTANRQTALPADNGHPSWPTPTLRAETLFQDKTNPISAPNSLSDGLTTARQWPTPAPQFPVHPTPPTPSAINTSRQNPHHR